MNDLEVYEVLQKHTPLLAKYQQRVKRYCSIEDFISEMFLRVRGSLKHKPNIKDNPNVHISYIKMIANQVASEIYKKNAFTFVGKRAYDTEMHHKVNKEFIEEKSHLGFEYEDSFKTDVDFLSDIKKLFTKEEYEIVELLSRGFNKEEVARKLEIGIGKVYSTLSGKIKPKLSSSRVETTESNARGS